MATRAEIDDMLRSIERLARLAVSVAADDDYLQIVTLRTSQVLRQLQEAEQLLMRLSSEPFDDLRECADLRDEH